MGQASPEKVSAAVLYMASEACDFTSHIISAAAGGFGPANLQRPIFNLAGNGGLLSIAMRAELATI